jgi:hypothetical protein
MAIISIFSLKAAKQAVLILLITAFWMISALARSDLALRACCFQWRKLWNLREYCENNCDFLRSSTYLFFSLLISLLSWRNCSQLQKYLVFRCTSSLISISPKPYSSHGTASPSILPCLNASRVILDAFFNINLPMVSNPTILLI